MNPEKGRPIIVFHKQGHLKAVRIIIMVLAAFQGFGCLILAILSALLAYAIKTDPNVNAQEGSEGFAIILAVIFSVALLFWGFGFMGALKENGCMLITHLSTIGTALIVVGIGGHAWMSVTTMAYLGVVGYMIFLLKEKREVWG